MLDDDSIMRANDVGDEADDTADGDEHDDDDDADANSDDLDVDSDEADDTTAQDDSVSLATLFDGDAVDGATDAPPTAAQLAKVEAAGVVPAQLPDTSEREIAVAIPAQTDADGVSDGTTPADELPVPAQSNVASNDEVSAPVPAADAIQAL